MQRLGSSDSLDALMPICPSTDELSPRDSNHYGREFQSILDGLDEEACVEESGGHATPKKRRLGVHQVKALEKNFELENKLEPERKVKLAQELGLQPRQVAIWFQNRRARWKTKQLERDYGVLKAEYESLKINYDSLQHNNEALRKEMRDLKEKLSSDNTESNSSVKEEIVLPESEDKPRKKQPLILDSAAVSETKNLIHESFNNNNAGLEMAPFFPDVKDGSSDSDSSAILNEDNSPNQAISSSAGLESHGELIMSPPRTSMNCFEFSSSRAYYQTQFVKMEEHNFFGNEETCNFFSDEQAPTLQWCCPDQWT